MVSFFTSLYVNVSRDAESSACVVPIHEQQCIHLLFSRIVAIHLLTEHLPRQQWRGFVLLRSGNH